VKYSKLILPSPEQNLACDEALLDWGEEASGEDVLRIWESPTPFVAVGYANQAAREVNLDYCREQSLRVLRRCTGGGTVLQGPGVLNYSLILRISDDGPLKNVTTTNRWVMERNRAALARLLEAPVEIRGHTDLALGNLKFCGNAQRRRQRFLLFHGSFLLNMDFGAMERILPPPSKQPDYRKNRPHSEFLMNLNVPANDLAAALLQEWEALGALSEPPMERITALAADKYASADWNLKF
jgi:lipoate---protein ligase